MCLNVVWMLLGCALNAFGCLWVFCCFLGGGRCFLICLDVFECFKIFFGGVFFSPLGGVG